MFRFKSSLIFLALAMCSNCVLAQDQDEEIDGGEIIRQLEKLLKHDDLNTSMAAFDALAGFQKSEDGALRFAAQVAVQKFNNDARRWLKENATFSSEPRWLKEKYSIISESQIDRLTPPDGLVYRPMVNGDVAFVDSDIDPGRLVYLKAIGLRSIAFVGMPQLHDRHLVCLRDQPDLISLTLEKTNVRGTGFQHSDIPSVEIIFLTGSPVTDWGLGKIQRDRFPNLSQLVVVDTNVSNEGVDQFKVNNPIMVRKHRETGSESR